MSQAQFPVTPGTVTPLTGSLAGGSVIINTDSNNAVWIADNPGVAPGNGVRLGPRGSMTWTTAGGAAYACLDAGVTTPITVTVSSDVSAVDNPVDIGVAVATQLLARGVPSVFLGKVIYNQNFTTGPQDLGGLDFSQYASITVCVSFPPGTYSQVAYTWQDNASGVYFGGRKLTISGGNTGITFTANVKGPNLQINCVSGALVQIYGTNRALGDQVLDVDPQSGDNTGNIAQTVGSKYAFQTPLTTNGGLHYFRANVSSGGKGYFGYYSVDVNGVQGLPILLDSGNSHAAPVTGVEINAQFILPPGRIAFFWLSEAAATYQVNYSIVPIS